MPIFLANRDNLQTKRLHRRVKHRFQTDDSFDNVRLDRANYRDPGTYRAIAESNPQTFLDDSSYPSTLARIEVGFDLFTADSYEHYWLNWVEPGRNLLVGFHQDDTHPELGPVHLQLNDGDEAVERAPATFIDAHPLDVFSRRLAEFPDVITAVEWNNGRPTSLDS